MLTSLLALAMFTIGQKSEPLPFNLIELKGLPQVELTVTEQDKPVTYSGVPMAALLKPHLSGTDRMADLRKLSDAAILVHAKDNYQAVFSAAEVAMDNGGKKFLVAFERNGKPLDETQGPARVIVPGDPMKVRWVRMIDKISLVRIGTP